VLRGENDCELPALLRYAAERKMELRLIELMPMGPLADQWQQRYVPEADMRRQLEAISTGEWEPLLQRHDAARRFRISLAGGGEAVVGFITPMSCNFCADCNRIRIASDGGIFPCLMDEPRGSIMPAVRPRFDAARFDTILQRAMMHKRETHPHDGYSTMTNIGG
jgi:cyclic pyranopterin phosphate synthase